MQGWNELNKQNIYIFEHLQHTHYNEKIRRHENLSYKLNIFKYFRRGSYTIDAAIFELEQKKILR